MDAGQGAGPRRLALALEYDGTGYRGFQVQPGLPTIQGELERALEGVLGESVRAQGAGRTDAGAHAMGQVVAISTRAPYDVGTLLRALNATLPGDIRVRAVREMEPAFDPRRHASSRVYRYLLLNQAGASAFWRRYAHHVPGDLDLAVMGWAGQALVGRHDFRAFCGRLQGAPRDTVRRVLRVQVERRGPLVSLEMEAHAFLPQQVRRTAGTLVRLGRGKMAPEQLRGLLDSPAPGEAGPALPARGLYLVRVVYEEGLQIDGPAHTGRGPVAHANTPSPGAIGDDWTPWLS